MALLTRTFPFVLGGLTFLSLQLSSGVGAQEALTPFPQDTGVLQADSASMETLLRGPLHEGYAEPITRDVEAGMVVAKKPPEAIEEIPPDAKPDDPSAMWIPGYWGWDEERNDYFWVSGIWRIPPPDRRWVPGYWNAVDAGYQWIAGMWAPASAREIEYLPFPPESLDQGPTVEAPSSDYYWVSGCWLYRNNRYAWQPGFWTPCRSGWVWLPSHYVWTPRGAIFVAGYWDFTFGNRGCVFAPVYFHRPIYTRPGFYYSPNVTIHMGGVMLSLFVQPRYHHYFWGDYYGPRYHQSGFVPWVEFGTRGYDPLLAYNRAFFRGQGIDFDDRIRGWHEYFVRHEDRRPPHTLAAQSAMAARASQDPQVRQTILGVTLREAMAGRDSPTKLRPVSQETRQSFAQASDQMRRIVQERSKNESARVASRLTIPDRGTTVVEAPRTGAKFKLPDTPLLVAPPSSRQPPSRQPPLARTSDDRPATEGTVRTPRDGTPDVPKRGTRDGGMPKTENRDTPPFNPPRDTSPAESKKSRSGQNRSSSSPRSVEDPAPSKPAETRDSRPLTTPREKLPVEPRTERNRTRPAEDPTPTKRTETRDSRPLTTPRDNRPLESKNERSRTRAAEDPTPTRRTETPDSRPLTTPRNTTPRVQPTPEVRVDRTPTPVVPRPETRSPETRSPETRSEPRESRPVVVPPPRENPRPDPRPEPPRNPDTGRRDRNKEEKP